MYDIFRFCLAVSLDGHIFPDAKNKVKKEAKKKAAAIALTVLKANNFMHPKYYGQKEASSTIEKAQSELNELKRYHMKQPILTDGKTPMNIIHELCQIQGLKMEINFIAQHQGLR